MLAQSPESRGGQPMVDIRSTASRRRHAGSSLAALLADVRPRVVDGLGAMEGEAFLARLEHAYLDIFEPLDIVYGQRTDTAALVGELVDTVLAAAVDRPA